MQQLHTCLTTPHDEWARQPLPYEIRSRVIGMLMVITAMLLWSSVPIATRWLVGEQAVFSAAFVSAIRLWIAVLVFVIMRLIYLRRSGHALALRGLSTGWLLIAGGALALNYLGNGIGLHYTTASATAIIGPMNAVTTVLLSAWWLNERLTAQKIFGMGAAITGVMLVVLHGAGGHDLTSARYFTGNLIQVISALVWSLYAVGQTKLLQRAADRQVLLPIFIIAALLTTLALPLTGPLIMGHPSLGQWGALLFLGLGSTAAAYWLFAAGVQRIETSVGAMFNVLAPPLALLQAHAFLGESLHPRMLAGLSLVIAGLVLLIWRRDYSPMARGHR